MTNPVEQVVVMEIHQNGHGLAQDDAAPHDDIADLPSGKGKGRQQPEGDLGGWVGALVSARVGSCGLAYLREHAHESPRSDHV